MWKTGPNACKQWLPRLKTWHRYCYSLIYEHIKFGIIAFVIFTSIYVTCNLFVIHHSVSGQDDNTSWNFKWLDRFSCWHWQLCCWYIFNCMFRLSQTKKCMYCHERPCQKRLLMLQFIFSVMVMWGRSKIVFCDCPVSTKLL
jgi:hypothetical protein